MKQTVVKAVQSPILRVEVGLDEDEEGMDYSIVFGTGEPVSEVKPEYVEAVAVAIQALEEVRQKVESDVIMRFIRKGREMRLFQKRHLKQKQEMIVALKGDPS